MDPAEEEEGREFAEIYLLSRGALYRLRARADAADENDPSEDIDYGITFS